jgi:hypothetical protein
MKYHHPQDATAGLEKPRHSETAASRLPFEQQRQTGGPTRVVATHPKAISKRLHRKQAAEYLGISLSWLDKSRISGLGAAFISIGGRIVYDTADLDEFLQKNRRQSTSE